MIGRTLPHYGIVRKIVALCMGPRRWAGRRPTAIRILAVSTLLILPLGPMAVVGTPEFSQPYLVLDAFKLSTLQKELDQAAALGYRVVRSWMLLGPAIIKEGGLGILLEKARATEGYEYLLVDSPLISSLQKKINEAAARGFQIIPDSLFGLLRKAFFFPGLTHVVMMNKTPKSLQKQQYLLLSTHRVSTMEKEINEAAAQGYHVVAIGQGDLNMVVALAKPGGIRGRRDDQSHHQADASCARRYKLVVKGKTSKLQESLNHAAAEGYRFVASSPNFRKKEAVLLELIPNSSSIYEYLLISVDRNTALSEELNDAASRGFHLLPHILPEVVVMEKAPEASNRCEYLLPTLKQVEEAKQQGFHLLLVHFLGIVMEKCPQTQAE